MGRLAVVCVLLAASSCAPAFEVDGGRMMGRVRHQVDAGPRIPGTPGHAAIREWIAAECTRLGATVETQSWIDSTTVGRRLPLTNVIARFPAIGSRDGNVRPLVLAAHWDTRWRADRDPDTTRVNEPVPGANDGGSGVAVLLEIAELLKRRPAAVPVELVFFDGEDQGDAGRPNEFCLGSRHYARGFGRDSQRLKPLVAYVFDMIGDAELNIRPEQQSVERAPNFAALVQEAARATGARHFEEAVGYGVYDDHMPLLEAGIPAVDLIDFDYDAWHTTRDLPDQVSAESLEEVARVAAWLVYRGPWSR